MICNKYKILVVEDDEAINDLLTTLLGAAGYQTICAYTCKNAQMLYTSHKPDLVILDLGLPDADGTVFLKKMRSEFLTPVIVLSARTDEKEMVDALDAGRE